jgi:Mg2+-importing ATPase
VGVGLTPEMLPMVVTGALAKGAVKLSRQKVIVKRLNAIQNIGAIDILCTDKTGTLTRDKIVLERYLDLEGREDDYVLRLAYLNSYYQSGLKNLLDVAVLDHRDLTSVAKEYVKFDEIPFDFSRRRMSVIMHWVLRQQELLICKGAVEEMLSVCTQARIQGQLVPFTDRLKADALKLSQSMNEDGLRVLGVGYKEVPSNLRRQFRVSDECDLIFCGFIAFLDPPKEDAAQAIKALHGFGVTVKVITGDNELVTRKICSWVELPIERLMLGSEVEKLSDEDLAEAAQHTTVFAKITPIQKARIIRALQSRDHTVGYLGDGINDAAALRDADVGISVDTAVDIAKESADIILLEKSLMVLEQAIIEGRTMFGNIVKYIKMTASSNFGNVFSVLGASAFLPFLPMLPLQLLAVNLCYDLSQTVIPWDRVDHEFIEKPRKWNAGGIARFMVFIGPISSIFDYATFGVMWFVFKANSPAHQTLFQSGWFVESLLSQTLIVHLIRTQKIPFLQSWAAMPLIVTALIIMLIGQVLPYTPFGHSLSLVPLPLSFFGWLWGILLVYGVLTQWIKGWYIRKFNEWI